MGPPCAGGEHRYGGQLQRLDQRRRIFSLFGHGRLAPSSWAWAAGVPAPIIGHDGELVCQPCGDLGKMAGVPRGAGDEQYRRARASEFIVQRGPIHDDNIMEIQRDASVGHR
jgi:hypothetical protein